MDNHPVRDPVYLTSLIISKFRNEILFISYITDKNIIIMLFYGSVLNCALLQYKCTCVINLVFGRASDARLIIFSQTRVSVVKDRAERKSRSIDDVKAPLKYIINRKTYIFNVK